MIITAGLQSFSPKKSDYTIADIAAKRGGLFTAHEKSDPSASEAYIKAHVRRLEALRRMGHAERNAQCRWFMASAKGLFKTRKLDVETDTLVLQNYRARLDFIRDLREMAQQLERDDWGEVFDDGFGNVGRKPLLPEV